MTMQTYENLLEAKKRSKLFGDFIVTDDYGRKVRVHPFYFEDDYVVEPDVVGGYNVWTIRGRYLGEVSDLDEINCL